MNYKNKTSYKEKRLLYLYQERGWYEFIDNLKPDFSNNMTEYYTFVLKWAKKYGLLGDDESG